VGTLVGFGSQGNPKILEVTMTGECREKKGYSKFEADASILQDIGLKKGVNFPKTKKNFPLVDQRLAE
jgi:hypothetical protein